MVFKKLQPVVPPKDESRPKQGEWGKEERDVSAQRMLYWLHLGLKEHKQNSALSNEKVSKQNTAWLFATVTDKYQNGSRFLSMLELNLDLKTKDKCASSDI